MDYEEENRRLIKEYRSTESMEVLWELYEKNRKLFVLITRRYRFYEEQEDLIQECFFALKQAAESYDESRGSFGAFLAIVTRNYICSYIQSVKRLKIPQQLQMLIAEYLSLHIDDKATDSEIMDVLHLTENELLKIKRLSCLDRIDSLDKPINEDEDLTLIDTISDPTASFEDDSIDRIFKEELSETIQKGLQRLSERERIFLIKRYYYDLTYKEIDPEHSEQNTRTIIEKGLRRLRRNEKIRSFYIDNNVMIGTGVKYFRDHNMSSVERVVILKEKYIKRTVEDYE